MRLLLYRSVYINWHGVFRLLPNVKLFYRLKRDFSEVQTVAESVFNALPIGAPLTVEDIDKGPIAAAAAAAVINR